MEAAAVVAASGRFSVRRVAATVGVSRSALMVAMRRGPGASPRRVPRRDDTELLARIRTFVDERPTYGYRRVTALLNRDANREERVNPKRVFRVMREHKLLLTRHSAKPDRSHDGKVMTLASNLRWCSDAFEIRCWSGERVHVAVALDCCDREVLAYQAQAAPITGETIRDLMAESIESRFGPGVTEVLTRIEWLSDNGPPYTANETRAFGAACGFRVVTTPSYSPESNGLAESFIKGFKRDYVYLAKLRDAQSVLAQLRGWFEDYNEVHPHRGLGMRSPREFRRAKSAA